MNIKQKSDGGYQDLFRWQEIDSAPRDGSRIIIAKIGESGHEDFGGIKPVHVWFAVTASWKKSGIDKPAGYWTDGLERLVEPTHWMPIPAVPATIENASKV